MRLTTLCIDGWPLITGDYGWNFWNGVID